MSKKELPPADNLEENRIKQIQTKLARAEQQGGCRASFLTNEERALLRAWQKDQYRKAQAEKREASEKARKNASRKNEAVLRKRILDAKATRDRAGIRVIENEIKGRLHVIDIRNKSKQKAAEAARREYEEKLKRIDARPENQGQAYLGRMLELCAEVMDSFNQAPTCPGCNQKFSSQRNLDKHVKTCKKAKGALKAPKKEKKVKKKEPEPEPVDDEAPDDEDGE
jgi:uncharacterized C2H2 Zn-finger protein